MRELSLQREVMVEAASGAVSKFLTEESRERDPNIWEGGEWRRRKAGQVVSDKTTRAAGRDATYP